MLNIDMLYNHRIHGISMIIWVYIYIYESYLPTYIITSPADSITEVSKKDMELTVEPNSAEALSTVQVAQNGAMEGVAKDWESDEIYGEF